MRWRHKPEHSNWGEFGPDDEVGRLNLITPEKVLQGIAELREGRTFCLSLPLDSIPPVIPRSGARRRAQMA